MKHLLELFQTRKLQLTFLIPKELKFKNEQFKYWPYNKLLTGKVLEELLYNNELKENIDFDDKKILTLSGIEKVDLFIRYNQIKSNKTF